jgi:hypothetical protein
MALACNSTDSSTPFHFANEGKICVFSADNVTGAPNYPLSAPESYAAGDMGNVAVQFPTCLSSSCTRNPVASCVVSGSGTDLQVTSEGFYTEQGGACTSDCGFLIARCSTPPLAAGTTTFQHGSSTVSLTVPFTGPPPCAGGPAP